MDGMIAQIKSGIPPILIWAQPTPLSSFEWMTAHFVREYYWELYVFSTPTHWDKAGQPNSTDVHHTQNSARLTGIEKIRPVDCIQLGLNFGHLGL